MAAKIISVLAQKYGFNAEEALSYYTDYKSEAGSTTSISTVQRAENAMNKTLAEIEDIKSKIPAKKGKQLENANVKLAKLEEKVAEQQKKIEEKKAKEEKKANTKPKEKKVKVEKTVSADEKRIKKMSPTLSKGLTKIFEEVGKEFKKEHGQQFAKYVNELVKDDFEAKKLEDHMREFVATITPPEPAKLPKPDEVEDEDMTEVKFNGIDYVVGDISKRVFIANEEDGDQFVGFLGLGKFKDMKISA